MMRRLFIASTVAFWLAIFAFWVVDPRLAAEAQPAAPATPADPGHWSLAHEASMYIIHISEPTSSA